MPKKSPDAPRIAPRIVVKINKNAKGKGAVSGTAAGTDPQNNIIVFFDDGSGNGGQFYMVQQAAWMNPEFVIPSTDGMFGTITDLIANGTYLASVPNEVGGAGYACTLVNQETLAVIATPPTTTSSTTKGGSGPGA